jgi:hypothetical protein
MGSLSRDEMAAVSGDPVGEEAVSPEGVRLRRQRGGKQRILILVATGRSASTICGD